MIWLLICLVIKKTIKIVTELFVRGIRILLYNLKYFYYKKNICLNSMHYFIMKTRNKQELQQIAFNHSSDVDFKDFINLSKKYTTKSYIPV